MDALLFLAAYVIAALAIAYIGDQLFTPEQEVHFTADKSLKPSHARHKEPVVSAGGTEGAA